MPSKQSFNREIAPRSELSRTITRARSIGTWGRSSFPSWSRCRQGATDIADLIARRTTPDIFEAASLGDVERVEKLLPQDPELVRAFRHDGWTALHLPAHLGKPEVAQFLLNVTAQRGTRSPVMPFPTNPCRQPSRAGNHSLRRCSSTPGPTSILVPTPASRLRTSPRRTGTLELLPTSGANLGARAAGGMTPLDLATEKHHETAVLWLRRQQGV